MRMPERPMKGTGNWELGTEGEKGKPNYPITQLPNYPTPERLNARIFRTVSKERLGDYIGVLDAVDMERVARALKRVLTLN